MCAVPVDGLHKDDVTREQLVRVQRLLKQRIPTGEHFLSCATLESLPRPSYESMHLTAA